PAAQPFEPPAVRIALAAGLDHQALGDHERGQHAETELADPSVRPGLVVAADPAERGADDLAGHAAAAILDGDRPIVTADPDRARRVAARGIVGVRHVLADRR